MDREAIFLSICIGVEGFDFSYFGNWFGTTGFLLSLLRGND